MQEKKGVRGRAPKSAYALFVLTEASSFSKQNIAWIKTLETEK